MPIVQFNLMTGRSVETKRQLMKEVTETVSRVLKVPPEKVRILIHEMEENDFAVAGTTFGEMREGAPRNVVGK